MEIGYVGLGAMGSRMVKRLMDAGYSVVGHNRTKSKSEWLIKDGMQWADSPGEVVEKADIILSMVTSTNAVQAITEGADGILEKLKPGKVYIDMTTMSPSYSRELAVRVSGTGAQMLDAPVSGSVATLEEGKLSVMVGGEKVAFEKALPVLQSIGPKVTHVGANGQALVMKIAANLSLAVQMLAFSEGVLLAEKSGISREMAVDVLLKSVIASPMVTYRGPFVLKQPEEAWFDCNMMQKDMLLALELGREIGVPLPTTTVTNELLTSSRGMGIDHLDFAGLFNVLAKMSGVKE
ncbi:MAG: NAD(P)-dependent oxidoreductase [SAR324 cluster bacterium]|nr:NAD(P)-dependent oxidoreductase [SAR324 cluster bacterium]